nr:MAG TPA: hypothetical protein [Caudoviricetes sp.]
MTTFPFCDTLIAEREFLSTKTKGDNYYGFDST